MKTFVINANGTDRWRIPSTGESSWLKYWEMHSGLKATKCGCCGSRTNLVGAHVIEVFGSSELYITPLCSSCNQKGGIFYVNAALVRVPSGL